MYKFLQGILMSKIKKNNDKKSSLPGKERNAVVNALLKTLNATDEKTAGKWAKKARKKLEDIQSDKVENTSGKKASKKIRKRSSK